MTDPTSHDGLTPHDAVRATGSHAYSADDATDRDRFAPSSSEADSASDDDFATAHGSSVPASAHANARTRPHDGPDAADGPQYGVGPFSVREVALLGVWAVAFLVSFFRTNLLDSPSGVLVGGENVWLSGLWWIPAIALPTVAAGLVALRRLSPQGIRRVGSLGIDQFASVAFTVSALVWVAWVWDTVAVFSETGIWTRSWVIWVEALFLLAGVVLTVFAPFIPPFSRDFRDRDEVPAHRSARPINPVVPRPRTPRPARTRDESPAAGAAVVDDADAPTPGSYTGSTDLAHGEAAPRTSVLPAHTDDDNATDVFAPLHAGESRTEVDRDDEVRDRPRDTDEGTRDERDHPHAQAFWALAPEEREIVDDYGSPIFRIGPTAWALVVEDRGETFVVRHDDGRIGYLHDVSGVTRG